MSTNAGIPRSKPSGEASPSPAQVGGSHEWHHLPASEALRILGSDPHSGLPESEARQRLSRFGPNKITPKRTQGVLLRFAQQFHQPLVYILLVASIVTGWLGEWVDSGVIAGVVVINAIVGFLQESKAAQAIDALASLSPAFTRVRRDGATHNIPTHEVVPGDIVILEAGDQVPADTRLFEARHLQIDESSLTGESQPVFKTAEALGRETVLADRRNVAYAGTHVLAGRGEGIVWGTGDHTETGRIAWLVAQDSDLSTPLTLKIAQFSKVLLWAILALATITFGIGVVRGEPPAEVFLAAVALAVGAIPEGLPAAVTIVLAIGVSRMARRRALIRRLPAVETLGSTTVICSDKTGTLTENRMTVQEIVAGGRMYAVTGSGSDANGIIQFGGSPFAPNEHPALVECLRAGMLCNDAGLQLEGSQLHLSGDPTESALLVAAFKGGLSAQASAHEAPRIDVIPFESEHMFRATLHDREGGRIIYQVGAVEKLIGRCREALGPDGAPVLIDPQAILRVVEGMASRGLRVIGCFRRHVESSHRQLDHSHVAQGLTFLGLQGMMDPPRAEAIEAVRRCQAAGIRVKMITGDHLATARAIASQIGIQGPKANQPLMAMTGAELAAVADEELPEVAEQTSVFARVAPEQKLRLVRALQSRGHVVAMTGDGVNDAPALRHADIGVAMGRGGTEIAKSAAAMILTDDNFASIEAAVEEGRGVFDNLTKFIVWTLPTNVGEAVILLAAILLGTQLPILPVQLLWINMMTAILLGLTLVFEPREPGVMDRPPRDNRQPLLSFELVMRTGLVSLIIGMGAFWLFHHETTVVGLDVAVARTAVVNVIVAVEIGYLWSCRSLLKSGLLMNPLSNRWVPAGILAMSLAQLALTYVPVMNTLFHTAPIPAETWLRIGGVALVAFAAVELEKLIRLRMGKR